MGPIFTLRCSHGSSIGPLFTESPLLQLDDILFRICAELQLDETRYDLATQSYKSAGKWLDAPGTLVAQYRPAIYPQGSMALNTTVKPQKGDEFDLDFVCEFNVDYRSVGNPIILLDLLEKRLRENEAYKSMVERKNRCIRLNYARQFYMDILPACHDPHNGGTCIFVPDRKLASWKASNPKGYVSWFEGRTVVRLVRKGIFADSEPIPPQQAVSEKPPLKLVVQLLKRWRDMRYASNQGLAPISIVLTTLAAQTYRGEVTISGAMDTILAAIVDAINAVWPKRLVVLNPSNNDEDLSERWDTDRGAYEVFALSLRELRSEWQQLRAESGLQNVTRTLQRLFGDELARGVVRKQAEFIEAARAKQMLGTKKQSGIVSLAASASPAILRNTFYGEEE